MEVKEIIDKVYETIDSLYEDGELKPYMRVYVDKDIIPELFKSITGTYTDNNPDTYIFKYRSTYNTDIEFVGIDSNLMNGNLIYFSNEGLKNIYSKFLKDEEMAQFIVDYFEYIYGKYK
jgi:hypothetical protein